MSSVSGSEALQPVMQKPHNNPTVSDNEDKQEILGPHPSMFQQILDTDVAWTRSLAVCATKDAPYGQWRPLMRFLEYSAHGVPWILGNVVAILATHKLHLHQVLLNLFYGLLLDLLIVTVIKAIVRRPRPAHNIKGDMLTISVDLYSFPSGHTTRAVMVAFFFLAHFPAGIFLDSLVILWGAAVSMSRILLGRHHVLDVTCGVLIGILQYRLLADYLWLSEETCENIIRPIQEELHL